MKITKKAGKAIADRYSTIAAYDVLAKRAASREDWAYCSHCNTVIAQNVVELCDMGIPHHLEEWARNVMVAA